MPHYREDNFTEQEKGLAQKAVDIYAAFFDTIRSGYIHKDWMKDWPTSDEIKGDYIVHPRSYAQAMKAQVALDVTGGLVRINHPRQHGGSRFRKVLTPLLLFTRSCFSTTKDNKVWSNAFERADNDPPTLDLHNHQIYNLPLYCAFPRNLETRTHSKNTTTGARLFPKATFSSQVMIEIDGETLRVELTQLNVELSPDDLYYHQVNTDDRQDGAPSTCFVTYIYLKAFELRTSELVLSALLRVRIAESTIGVKWNPSMASHESTPDNHRVNDQVRLGPPSPTPSSSRRSLIREFANAFTLAGYSNNVGGTARHTDRYPDSSPYSSTVANPSQHPSNQHYLSLGVRQQGIYRTRYAGAYSRSSR